MSDSSDEQTTRPRLNLVVLRTADLERLRAFYAALGLALVSEQHGGGPVHYSAAAGPVTLELYPATDTVGPDPTTRVGFAVDDAGRACAVLRAAGHTVRAEPKASPWGVRAVVLDPDGRSVELLQQPRDG